MLQIDQKARITVDGALAHPYVSIWYDPSEVNSVSKLCVNNYMCDLCYSLQHTCVYLLHVTTPSKGGRANC